VEPHIKERIVGAAVLVALGVWLIPWILDGPDDVVAESETLPEISLPPVEPIARLRTDNPAPDRSAPDVVDEQPARLSEAVAAASDEATTQAPVESSPPADTDDEATTQAPPPVASSAEPTPDRGGWSVQLGAFGEKANADQLASRVSTYGYDTFVSEFRSNGGTMYRVRVDGFASENQADAAASSISAHSIPARVIPPE
jgi:DedD protein